MLQSPIAVLEQPLPRGMYDCVAPASYKHGVRLELMRPGPTVHYCRARFAELVCWPISFPSWSSWISLYSTDPDPCLRNGKVNFRYPSGWHDSKLLKHWRERWLLSNCTEFGNWTTDFRGCWAGPALLEIAILAFNVVLSIRPVITVARGRGPDPSGVNICQVAHPTTAQSLKGKCQDGWHRLIRCRIA